MLADLVACAPFLPLSRASHTVLEPSVIRVVVVGSLDCSAERYSVHSVGWFALGRRCLKEVPAARTNLSLRPEGEIGVFSWSNSPTVLQPSHTLI